MSKNNPAWGKPNSPIGRVNRKEYFTSSFCLLAYTMFALYFGIFLFAFRGMVSTLLGVLFIGSAGYLYWKYLMICVKRWHDLNLSGWLCLLTFFPSTLALLYLVTLYAHWIHLALSLDYVYHYAEWGLMVLSAIQFFIPGTKGENKYGPDPLAYEEKPSKIGLYIGIFFYSLILIGSVFISKGNNTSKEDKLVTYYASAISFDIMAVRYAKENKDQQYPCGVTMKKNVNETISVDFPEKCIPQPGEERYQIPIEKLMEKIEKLVSKNATFKCEERKCIYKKRF